MYKESNNISWFKYANNAYSTTFSIILFRLIWKVSSKKINRWGGLLRNEWIRNVIENRAKISIQVKREDTLKWI